MLQLLRRVEEINTISIGGNMNRNIYILSIKEHKKALKDNCKDKKNHEKAIKFYKYLLRED